MINLKHKSNLRGFTLLELLVSLVLLGLLLTMAGGLFHMGLSSWAKTSKLVSDRTDIEAAQNLIRNILSRTLPYKAMSLKDSIVDFSGDKNAIIFISQLPQSMQERGIVRMRMIYQKRSTDNGDLIIGWQQLSQTNWNDQVILSGIRDAKFEYWGSYDHLLQQWSLTWNQQSKLPEAIRLNLTFNDSDGRYWPELVVEPRISSYGHEGF